jgi:hypothetical protein
MTLHEANQAVNKFRDEYPEKIFLLGSDFEFTQDRLLDLACISDHYYLSENITEDMAMEKAIKFFLLKGK